MHILPNIWGRKGNQTMKFGQLIECNLRSMFPEKSYTIADHLLLTDNLRLAHINLF